MARRKTDPKVTTIGERKPNSGTAIVCFTWSLREAISSELIPRASMHCLDLL